ncbi:MAG: hypothetical protein V1873_00100 [Verrucomicrobiota bacterium]
MKRSQSTVALLTALLLTGCATSKPAHKTDPELARLANTARTAFDRGSVEQATRLYGRALDMARAQDDAIEAGNNAYNLAACMISLGKNDDARALLEEARKEFERAGRVPANILLLEAKVARSMGRLDDASALVDQVLPSFGKSAPSDAHRVQVALLKAHIACDRKDVAAARAALDEARATLRRASDNFLEAEASGASARISLVANDPAKAGAAYDAQAEWYRKAQKYRDMALATGRAGRAYEDAAVLIVAGDRYYRSARSLFAQGDDVAALKTVERALGIAERTSDKDLLARTTSLFNEIRQRAKGKSPAPEPAKP